MTPCGINERLTAEHLKNTPVAGTLTAVCVERGMAWLEVEGESEPRTVNIKRDAAKALLNLDMVGHRVMLRDGGVSRRFARLTSVGRYRMSR